MDGDDTATFVALSNLVDVCENTLEKIKKVNISEELLHLLDELKSETKIAKQVLTLGRL